MLRVSGPIGPEAAALIEGAAAVMVASRDAELRPEIARGWGAAVLDDGAAVRVCLIAPPGTPTRENLATNGQVSMNCTVPSTYRALQVKGTVIELGEPDEEDLERARAHARRFVAETAKVGAPAPGEHYVQAVDLALTFAAHEVFDQTPGPAAGSRA
jgi:hypothetical protein